MTDPDYPIRDLTEANLIAGQLRGTLSRWRDEGIEPERLAELYRRLAYSVPDAILMEEYRRRGLDAVATPKEAP